MPRDSATGGVVPSGGAGGVGGIGGGIPIEHQAKLDPQAYEPPPGNPDLQAANIVFHTRIDPKKPNKVPKFWSYDVVFTNQDKEKNIISRDEAVEILARGEEVVAQDWEKMTENLPGKKEKDPTSSPIDPEWGLVSVGDRTYTKAELMAIANSPDVAGADDPTGTTSALRKDAAKNDEMRRKLKKMLTELIAKLESGDATLEDVVRVIAFMTNEMKMGLLDSANVVVKLMEKVDVKTSKAQENVANLTGKLNMKNPASYHKLDAEIKRQSNIISAARSLHETIAQYLQTGLGHLREMTDYNNSILAGFLEYTRSASRVG